MCVCVCVCVYTCVCVYEAYASSLAHPPPVWGRRKRREGSASSPLAAYRESNPR